MENLEFKSVNNFEVDISNNITGDYEISATSNDVLKSLNTTNESSASSLIEIKTEIQEPSVLYKVASISWLCTTIMAYIIITTAIVSLTLNIVRKNAGKAIFSGVSFIIPIIAMIIASFGRTLHGLNADEIYEFTPYLIIPIMAFIVDIVVEIILFIFCFSKNKNKTPKE